MTLGAWRLPWDLHSAPHGVLDILRGCNLSCRACYNTQPPRVKSLEEVRQEFALLMHHRRLDAVAIAGGEPTLHPQLPEIVRLIKAVGMSVDLFTNAVDLPPQRLAELKAAGADVLFLHLDAQQGRPDLAARSPAALRALRAAKAAAVAAAGLEVGLAITAYRDALEEIDAAVDFVLTSPHVQYLLVTLCRDVQALGTLTGDLDTGIRGSLPARPTSAPRAAPAIAGTMLDNRRVAQMLRERRSLRPFAYVGSNVDPNDPRWLSYLVGAVVTPDGGAQWACLRPSGCERLFLWAHHRLRGRYPFYQRQSGGRSGVQLLLNALTGGSPRSNLALLARALRPGRKLLLKKLLFQCPAELDPGGRLIHCACCPDAVVRHRKLVPVCVSDQVVAAASSASS